jgi:hypothetical protein
MLAIEFLEEKKKEFNFIDIAISMLNFEFLQIVIENQIIAQLQRILSHPHRLHILHFCRGKTLASYSCKNKRYFLKIKKIP